MSEIHDGEISTEALKAYSEENIEQNKQEDIINFDQENPLETQTSSDFELETAFEELETLSLEQLNKKIKSLLEHQDLLKISKNVEQVKTVFLSKYKEIYQDKRAAFFEGETEINPEDFVFLLPEKETFDKLYSEFKTRRNSHFKSQQELLKNNLTKRKELIEELKNIVDNANNMNSALKDVQQLREQWKLAGAIPRDTYNLVWNNYHFHLERFYDQLHLDREARDADFKFNLEQKQKLIQRAQELLSENDIQKTFRELQMLHKVWKEDIGPVSKEYRETIWNTFSEITKKLHDKKEEYLKVIKQEEEKNSQKKLEIVKEIEAINNEKIVSHTQWQEAIKKVNHLREQFFQIKNVSADLQESIWEAFREATKNFNVAKNIFYKSVKKEQQNNLQLKKALIEKAKSYHSSDDFTTATPIMKQIQEDWKKIGHVPKKQSDEIWKEFKEVCNFYFNRLHALKNEAIQREMHNFERKKEYLEQLKSFELQGNPKTDLEAIKQHIENWKQLGVVPQSRRHIEGKFNKILDALFDKLSMSKKDAELVKFQNRLQQLSEENDSGKIQHELVFLQRKIDELQGEILQLENNVMFISGAKKDNPLVKEINKNIDRHREELNLWKEKLVAVKKIAKN